MAGKRIYGDAIAHSFGVENPPTLATRSLRHGQVAISRLSISADRFGMSPRIPPEDTFIACIYLTEVPHHELWSHGRPFIRQGYAPRGMRVVNLVDEFSANISCAHESLTFYLPRHALDELADEAGVQRVGALTCTPGVIDPVVSSMVDTLLAAFDRPGEVSPLFIEHASLAVSAHLVFAYGGGAALLGSTRGGLTPAQARRAKAMLADLARRDLSLAEVAQECGLSRGYFTKAFKANTGLTPHQWRQRYRIDCARVMLSETRMDVAEIALACGFSDQSHLTRVFLRLVGVSPGRWRRRWDA